MAATIARLHRMGPHPGYTQPGPRPAEAFPSEADAADRLLDRIAAAGAVALLMALLFGLLVGEYLLVWRLIFAPWTGGASLLMP
jgi:hypothetical protein